jgi:Zn-finger nucleic acid-binding protein
MQCPVCDTPLRTIEKYGVEVEICPGCKGVWLDRGELEKIVELEAAGGPAQEYAVSAPVDRRPREAQPRYQDERRYEEDRDHERRQPQYDQHGRPYKKKRESWFGEIFEMFGD